MRRALITSGGGAKGAFTIGALKCLVANNIDQFDIISGTSTGSLIAILTACREFTLMETIYQNVENDDILKKQNIVDNILNDRPYIYDTDPLLKTIDQNLSDAMFARIKSSNTLLCLTAISLQSGKVTVFCTRNIPSGPYYDVKVINTRSQLIDAAMASSSQAGFLKPVVMQTGIAADGSKIMEQFVDGGNREVIPTRIATTLHPDEIYVLSNNPPVLFPHNPLYTSVMQIILRAIAIFIQDVRENDMAVLKQYRAEHPDCRIFRIEPEHDLDPEHPTGLNFSKLQMTIWKSLGVKAAQAALQTGGNLFV